MEVHTPSADLNMAMDIVQRVDPENLEDGAVAAVAAATDLGLQAPAPSLQNREIDFSAEVLPKKGRI